MACLAAALLLAGCGGDGETAVSQSDGGVASTEAEQSTTVEQETTTTTEPISQFVASGTQVFGYQGDEVEVTIEAAPPLAGPEATEVYCSDEAINPRAPQDGQLIVPFRLTYELRSSSSQPGSVRIAVDSTSAWLDDPEAATYDGVFAYGAAEFRLYNELGVVALDLSDGPSCAARGGMPKAFTVSVGPGEARSVDGWVVFPRAVDRYHADGDPRLVADVQMELAVSVDGAFFEFVSGHGELTEGACERRPGQTWEGDPVPVTPFLRLTTDAEPWCRD